MHGGGLAHRDDRHLDGLDLEKVEEGLLEATLCSSARHFQSAEHICTVEGFTHSEKEKGSNGREKV